MTHLPPRWLNCPSVGNPVGETKFIPFKTPLSAKFANEIPEGYETFTPGDLFSICEESQIQMGLIIDLTKTDRYYNKKDIEETYKCKYKKLQCDGHGETPPDSVVTTFNAICEAFWRQNPNKYIGVHCTHGFNRTGYLISSYMVEHDDLAIETATQFFAAARPAGIYKDHYLKKLFEKYGGDEQDLILPGRPDWEDEDALQAEMPQGEGYDDTSNGTASRKRSHEETNAYGGVSESLDDTYEMYRGMKRVKYMQGLTGKHVGVHVSDTLRETIWTEVAGLCKFKNVRQFPGSQPVSMDKENIKLLEQEPFMASWKADGTRYLMYIRKEETYFIDRDNNVFEVQPRLTFPFNEKGDTFLKNTLMDGEMVEDKDPVSGDLIPRFLIYDLINWEGNAIGFLEPLDRRLKMAEKQIIRPRKACAKKFEEQMKEEPFHLRIKKFFPIQKAKYIVTEVMPKLTHENDGLILTPVRMRYVSGRFLKLMKWKPPELNSVDFLLKFEITGNAGERKVPNGFLFVLNYPEPVGKLHVPLKQLKEYDNKIIECTWDPLIGPDGAQWTKERILATQKRDPKFKCGNWKFMRIRTDKSLPNGFKTLQGCLRSISHGLTEKELLEFVSTKAKPYHETADNRLPEIKHPGGNHHDNSQLTTGSEHPDAGERPIAL